MRHVSPFIRNLAILALVAIVIVVLNLEVALFTVGLILRLAFFIAIAVVAYLMWRDFGRREIGTWSSRPQWVFYGAVGLFVVDLGWWLLRSPSGRDALAFFVVAAACVYAMIRTWRSQRSVL
jgi:hypothetical protein